MRIALGVSGGVAAYKAAELVRRLQQESLEIQVVMTRSAREFVTPLTFAALTGQKVITDLFGGEAGGESRVQLLPFHVHVSIVSLAVDVECCTGTTKTITLRAAS